MLKSGIDMVPYEDRILEGQSMRMVEIGDVGLPTVEPFDGIGHDICDYVISPLTVGWKENTEIHSTSTVN